MRQKHQNPQQTLHAQARRFVFAAFLFLLGSAGPIGSIGPAALFAQSTAPTRTTLASGPARSGTGTTLSATVTTTTGAPVNAGTVDFLLPNGQALGSAIVSADGAAALDLATLPAGTPAGVDGSAQLAISAVYHANAAPFSDSVSIATAVASPAATTQVPDFTATANPATVSAVQGSYGTTALTVTSVGNYSGTIQFSCSNLPAQVTCVFNPTQQVLAANGTFTGNLQLQTQAVSGPTAKLAGAHGGLALALAFPGALALLGLSRRFRGTRMLGIALLLVGAGLGLSGCNPRYYYTNHPPPVAGGAGPGTYPITVAVDGGAGSTVIEHDVTVSLVIQ